MCLINIYIHVTIILIKIKNICIILKSFPMLPYSQSPFPILGLKQPRICLLSLQTDFARMTFLKFNIITTHVLICISLLSFKYNVLESCLQFLPVRNIKLLLTFVYRSFVNIFSVFLNKHLKKLLCHSVCLTSKESAGFPKRMYHFTLPQSTS